MLTLIRHAPLPSPHPLCPLFALPAILRLAVHSCILPSCGLLPRRFSYGRLPNATRRAWSYLCWLLLPASQALSYLCVPCQSHLRAKPHLTYVVLASSLHLSPVSLSLPAK